MINVKWFGHSMWKIYNDNVSIIIDPFTDIGYPMPVGETADIILSSHDHFDHNNFSLISGNPEIVNKAGKYKIKSVNIELIETWHDEDKGKERGLNHLLIFEFAGKRFLHCGDLGHALSSILLKQIGKIDVLMVPVGGYYTIDAAAALDLKKMIDPIITFPMHYKTEVIDFPIAPKEAYLDLIDGFRKIDSNIVQLLAEDFKQQQTIIMNYI
jgi:L-ascorbate metabolism protein UlaG (beta-lactamase superfamily)